MRGDNPASRAARFHSIPNGDCGVWLNTLPPAEAMPIFPFLSPWRRISQPAGPVEVQLLRSVFPFLRFFHGTAPTQPCKSLGSLLGCMQMCRLFNGTKCPCAAGLRSWGTGDHLDKDFAAPSLLRIKGLFSKLSVGPRAGRPLLVQNAGGPALPASALAPRSRGSSQLSNGQHRPDYYVAVMFSSRVSLSAGSEPL